MPSCVDAPAIRELPLSNSERRVKRFRVLGLSMRRIDEGAPASGVRSSQPRCLLSAVLAEFAPGRSRARSGRGRQDVQRGRRAVGAVRDAGHQGRGRYRGRNAHAARRVGSDHRQGRQALTVEGCTLSGGSGKAGF